MTVTMLVADGLEVRKAKVWEWTLVAEPLVFEPPVLDADHAPLDGFVVVDGTTYLSTEQPTEATVRFGRQARLRAKSVSALESLRAHRTAPGSGRVLSPPDRFREVDGWHTVLDRTKREAANFANVRDTKAVHHLRCPHGVAAVPVIRRTPGRDAWEVGIDLVPLDEGGVFPDLDPTAGQNDDLDDKVYVPHAVVLGSGAKAMAGLIRRVADAVEGDPLRPYVPIGLHHLERHLVDLDAASRRPSPDDAMTFEGGVVARWLRDRHTEDVLVPGYDGNVLDALARGRAGAAEHEAAREMVAKVGHTHASTVHQRRGQLGTGPAPPPPTARVVGSDVVRRRVHSRYDTSFGEPPTQVGWVERVPVPVVDADHAATITVRAPVRQIPDKDVRVVIADGRVYVEATSDGKWRERLAEYDAQLDEVLDDVPRFGFEPLGAVHSRGDAPLTFPACGTAWTGGGDLLDGMMLQDGVPYVPVRALGVRLTHVPSVGPDTVGTSVVGVPWVRRDPMLPRSKHRLLDKSVVAVVHPSRLEEVMARSHLTTDPRDDSPSSSIDTHGDLPDPEPHVASDAAHTLLRAVAVAGDDPDANVFGPVRALRDSPTIDAIDATVDLLRAGVQGILPEFDAGDRSRTGRRYALSRARPDHERWRVERRRWCQRAVRNLEILKLSMGMAPRVEATTEQAVALDVLDAQLGF